VDSPYRKSRFEALMLVGRMKVENPSDDILWRKINRIMDYLLDTLGV
jgi:hypothetical protein